MKADKAIKAVNGLSPRGRGNLVVHEVANPEIGSIPAWAGESGRRRRDRNDREVYPRVGGGTSPAGTANILRSGLSPRGRGNPK